ncbi:ATP-binding protein [Salinispirillum marinum]|uniref:histidine kinase n=2 Tax=Saccharospirillaceae TaxID=255527 RepID=A0ABV8BAH6_9GAMM
MNDAQPTNYSAALKALMRSQQRHNALLSLAGLGTWEYDVVADQITHWSEHIYTMAGLNASATPPSVETYLNTLHPDDGNELRRLMRRAIERGEPYCAVLRHIHPDGSIRWAEAKGVALQENGQTVALMGSLLDITAQKENAFALARANELLERSSKAVRMGTWEIDVRKNQVYWSPVTRAIHEIPEDYVPVTEKGIQFFPPGAPRDTIIEHYTRLLETGASYDLELPIITYRGQERWVRTISFADMEGGRCVRTYGLFQDITERKRIEQMKSEFLSTVSHELRTPITAISGSLKLINEGVFGAVSQPDIAELLTIAEQNSARLLNLINDLLDIERLTSGRVTFNLTPQWVEPLLEQALRNNQSFAEQHRVSLRVSSEIPPVKVNLDAGRFLQIMDNLLSNAIKFSPSGATVELTAMVENTHEICLCVRDHGMGVPADFVPRLFERFAQADASDRRKIGGTGLGLAIALELVHGMSGTLNYVKPKGDGAAFRLVFPVTSGE